MDRAFSTVNHSCFFPYKKLQSVLNNVDLPLSISYYRLLGKMLFRINVSVKKRKTHRWGEILCFIYNAHRMLQKMCNSAFLGHFSVGRRIRCNTPALTDMTILTVVLTTCMQGTMWFLCIVSKKMSIENPHVHSWSFKNPCLFWTFSRRSGSDRSDPHKHTNVGKGFYFENVARYHTKAV